MESKYWTLTGIRLRLWMRLNLGVLALLLPKGFKSETRLISPEEAQRREQRPRGITSPPNPTLKANREWLVAHRMEYRGQWIALRNGELLATGTSIEEVESQIKDVPRRVDGHLQVLMTRA